VSAIRFLADFERGGLHAWQMPHPADRKILLGNGELAPKPAYEVRIDAIGRAGASVRERQLL